MLTFNELFCQWSSKLVALTKLCPYQVAVGSKKGADSWANANQTGLFSVRLELLQLFWTDYWCHQTHTHWRSRSRSETLKVSRTGCVVVIKQNLYSSHWFDRDEIVKTNQINTTLMLMADFLFIRKSQCPPSPLLDKPWYQNKVSLTGASKTDTQKTWMKKNKQTSVVGVGCVESKTTFPPSFTGFKHPDIMTSHKRRSSLKSCRKWHARRFQLVNKHRHTLGPTLKAVAPSQSVARTMR